MSCVVLHVNTACYRSDCYPPQVYVYDWEADHEVGVLPVPMVTMFLKMVLSEGASEACDVVTSGTATISTSTPGVYNYYLYLIIHMNFSSVMVRELDIILHSCCYIGF